MSVVAVSTLIAGTMQEMGTSYSDGKVTFLTDHFSYFVIVSDSAEPSPAGDGTNQTLLIAAAIIVAVLVIAAVAYAAKNRKT